MSCTKLNEADETESALLKEPKVPNSSAKRSMRELFVLLIHWAIIVNFAIEIIYASYMIFDVLAVGDGGPIGEAALNVDHEHMVTRRLYAIEFWLAMGGLAIYLAITEIGPRLSRMRGTTDTPPAK